MEKIVTIRDVANAAGVSLATVSRVINSPESVRDERRKQVENAIKELGYMPNQAARALVKRQTETIGIIVNNLHDPFFYDLIRGFETGAQQTSYKVIFCSVMNGDVAVKEKYIQYLNKGVVDGVVLYGSYLSDKELTRYMSYENAVRYLLIENDLSNLECNKLLIDNIGGARAATQYLIDHGHTNIAHICGNLNRKVMIDRFNGFVDCMRSNGLELHDGSIQYTMAEYSTGYRSMKLLLEQENRPTAVFCSDDAIASYAVMAALDAGLRVPEDISIIGFDNQTILPEKYIGPEITSVEQPLFQIGYDSIKLLADQLCEREGFPIKKVYETKIVEKQSTCYLNAQL